MYKPKSFLTFLAVFSAFSAPLAAQNFTTAAEVKPILSATKPNWVAVRLYEGRDLLYFTNLLAWRCGVDKIEYAVNGGALQTFNAEPCYLDQPQPNALQAESLEAILVPFEPSSVAQVQVKVTFDDGTIDSASYDRKAIQID